MTTTTPSEYGTATTTTTKKQFEDYTVGVRNRFKGLDLIDRVSDELWTVVSDIV